MRPARGLVLVVLLLIACASLGFRPGAADRPGVARAGATSTASTGFGDATPDATARWWSAAHVAAAAVVASPWQRQSFHAQLAVVAIPLIHVERASGIVNPAAPSRPHAPPHLLTDSLRI